jgi:WD40 repeat protein
VYSANGKRFATGSAHGVAKVFDATSGFAIRKLPGNAGIASAALSPDGTRLIIGYRSKDPETAKVWELSSDQSPRALVRDNPVFGLAFSPDGKRAVTSGFVAPGHAAVPAKVWDIGLSVEPFKELFSLSESAYHGLIAYSPDGKQIANNMRVWNAATGSRLFAIPQGEDNTVQLAFDRDAKRLATVIHKAVKVWNLAAQKKPFTLDTPLAIDNGADVMSLTFTSDGKFLATVSSDWTMRLHPLGIEDLMTLARQRVPRELSADERRNYLHTK